jgi:hypothetical protein
MSAVSTSRVAELNQKLDSLPSEQRERFAAYISDHFEDIEDEMKWDESFSRTSEKLAEFAREARKQMAEGLSEEMDFDKL